MSRTPIACEHYVPIQGSRRCRDYLANGGCARPNEFMCVEWLRLNSKAQPPAGPQPPPLGRDLFGQPLPAPKEAVRLPVLPPPARPAAPAAGPQALDESLASFRERGLEVRLATELGEVWIVPAYTGADRTELLVEHAALIATVASALPGARVTAIAKK